jgi:3-deoxy-D-manno-octulosonic-acid transferase
LERYQRWVLAVGYFPIDWWPFVGRAWRKIRPDLLLLAEGERWPEHLHHASKRGVPVIAMNARLSDRSFARLKMFPRASRLVLSNVTRLLTASHEDEMRFLKLGVPAERVLTTGNIKLDVDIPQLSPAELAVLRTSLGLPENDLVILGSSTWPGEEAALVSVLQRARHAGLRCSLLIVPRHAERRADVERVLVASGLRYHFRSRGAAPADVDVSVADTTGELRRLTQLADAVFVGKSLAPNTEGQTPVEAAALQKPILFGPGMSNFRLISRDLLARGAACEVKDGSELAAAIVDVLRDPSKRAALAEAAARWRSENLGAVQRTLQVIHDELSRLKR